MVSYRIPELYYAHRISYNLITGMVSTFLEPNLSILVVSAAKMAIIGTVCQSDVRVTSKILGQNRDPSISTINIFELFILGNGSV